MIKAPPSLLIPSKNVEIRGGQLVTKASASLGKRQRAFFDRYQLELGWGAGLFEELRQAQLEWSVLPPDMQKTLRETSIASGMPTLFSAPDEEICLKRYLSTRQSEYRGDPVLMPFVELVNCSGQATTNYAHEDGIAVAGTFDDEILVNYNITMDCWDRAVYYGFFDATIQASSLAFRYQSAEGEAVQVHKFYEQRQYLDKMRLPVARLAADGAVAFSYLMLGHSRQPRLPRGIFQHLCKEVPLQHSDEMFELIQHYNRSQLLRFLSASENMRTSLMTMLRRAAYQQLTTLSHCWGSLPLADQISR
jgi:hypothetical protein